MEKLEIPVAYTADRNVHGTVIVENSFAVPQKIKHRIAMWSRLPRWY